MSVIAALATAAACASGGSRSTTAAANPCTPGGEPLSLAEAVTATEIVSLREEVEQAMPASASRAEIRMSVHRGADSTVIIVAETTKSPVETRAIADRMTRVLPPLPFDTTADRRRQSDGEPEGPLHHFRLIVSAEPGQVPVLSAERPAICRPALLNGEEIVDILTRAATSVPNRGTVVMWMFLEQGEVTRVQVKRTSGDEVVDALGMTVGYAARFSPATLDGYMVPVWVQFPITIAD